jgi:radical SAM superfamily enzyme YgiQ (UPF0313 family)
MQRQDLAAWYRATHHELLGAGLWLRGGELNTLPASELDARTLRVLFARLSTYFDTGYSFTHQLLYQLAARIEGVFPDLAYLPPRADLGVFERDGIPWLLGTQTKRGAAEFDVIGVSNSIVQELINLPTLLARSGIPRSKAERMERVDIPLVLLGGANSLYSTVLWTPDPPVDAVFVGEDDGAITRLMELARDAKREGLSKRELLARWESIDGLIQPDRPRRTKKAFIWSLDKAAHLETAPVYHIADAAGSAHLQISEGCPCFCSFCAESWDRKPYRERKAPVLLERALALKAAMGLDEIELYSFNFNMHSGFYQVLWDLAPHFRRIGLKSQRFDLLANDREMVHFQHAVEKASLTCGLEGISPRMRAYLHKNLETDDLHTSLEAIFSSKARALKVFLIATGLEETQDFDAFSDLLGHMAEVKRNTGAGTRVLFSMTPLVRFPWTPLEYEDAPQSARYADVIARTAERVRNHGFEFRESAELEEYWVSQVLVRATDPRVLEALEAAVAATGFLYFREVTDKFREAFEAALVARGLSIEALFRGHSFEEGESKPWAAIGTGVHRSFLWDEVLRARRYHEIDYCLGRAWTRAKCFKCGGCPSKEHVRDIVLAKQERGYSLHQFQQRVRAARAAEREVVLDVEVGPAARGLPRKLFGVALAKALMRAEPALVAPYAGFVRSAQGGDGSRPTWSYGADRVTLRFHECALPLLRALADNPARRGAVDRHLMGTATSGGAETADAGSVLGRLIGVRGALAPGAGEEPSALRWTIESPYPFEPRAYLEGEALPHTLRRRAGGGYEYEWSAKAKKRDVVRSLVSHVSGDGCVIELVPGRRFELESFLQRAFRLPRSSAWVQIVARAELVSAGVAMTAR